MAEDLVSIGIALDTSKVLQGTKQVDTALKQVAAASTTTAQATQKMDAAAKTAGQAFTGESQAAQAVAQALRQEAQASGTAASQTSQVTRASQAAAQALQKEQQAALASAEALHKKGQAAGTSASLMQRLTSSVGEFGRNVGAFALAQAGLQGLQAAFSTVKDAIVDIVKTGLQMSQLRGSFAAIAGGVTAGNREFQFAVDTAIKLGVGLQSLAEQYRSLSAATRGTTLAGADTRAIFVALTQAAQAYGLSNEQLGRAMAAVQQIISKGKVSMEELRGQLGEALPGAMQITARAYGTNTAALEDMVAKGMDGIDWARRFTAQLKTEVPPAADRAGKGIANLGTEILLLKDHIAQSGLLAWLDAAARKAADAMKAVRNLREEQRAQAELGVKAELPAGTTPDMLKAQEREKLVEVTARLNTAVDQLAAAEKRLAQAQEQAPGRGRFTSGTSGEARAVAQARALVDSIKAEQTELTKAAAIRSQADERAKARQGEIVGMANDEKAILRDKNTLLEGAKKLLEAQRKETEAMITATKAGLGRDPSAEEKAKLGEKQLKDTRDFYEANAKVLEQYKDDPAIKALRERAKLQEAATQAIKDDKKEAKDDAREAKAAEAEQDRLDKERRGNVMDSGKLILKGYEEEGDKLTDLLERTHKLSMTEEERWALMIKGIKDPALREYGEELLKQYETALRYNEALKERPRLLADEARASAAVWKDLQTAMKDFKPGRKGETAAERETRLDTAYRRLTEMEGVSSVQLGQAADKWAELNKQGLDTEVWKAWEDAGMAALDHVGEALEEFVFKGKLNFKDLLGSIAQDIFRASLQMVQQQATKQGGWLEMGLNLLQKVPGLFGGGGGAGASPGAWGYDAASGLFTMGGKQHGGPVMAGRPYMVGEAGPELFVPRSSGTVLPHGQGVSSPTVVNVHVSGVQDAQSFVQSRGAVSRAIMGALSQARQQM